MQRARNASTQYIKLERRLVLLAWLNALFAYESNKEMLADLRQSDEGFDGAGRSYISLRLESRGEKIKIPLADLVRYDDNIREHLRAMNLRRPEPITLRYFQYIAVLYTEIFLDWNFHRRRELLLALNTFVQERNAGRLAGDLQDSEFTEHDLTKLAFWMATGSGKTLIMHINYRQFLHYNDLPLDNILLITPNEGLSEQHIAEMRVSGVPCQQFDLNESGLGFAEKDVVRVIEITKLVEEKRGGGASVPVEAFEGNNLILVDEGHKGAGGEAWRGFRDALGETGFTFEYSATFGQALTAAQNDPLTAEYGKAIIFDYSYRYFHGDGYGKDFRILNLKEATTEDKAEILLLGNLLSFYEQLCMFEDHKDELRSYNIDKPLWVFVGSRVTAVYTEDKQKRSDVLTVARFLHHLLENKRGWAVRMIRKLLEGKTELVTPDGRDVFADRFEYLRQAGLDAGDVYKDIVSKVLHAPIGGGLHLSDMRGHSGELGLRASGAQKYFGLIYIGDTSAFKKLVEVEDSGIILEEDVIAESQFAGINEPETSINILIGAKKFMEGWNSWRVSTMGLLNIGRKEGSQIIQLFGRGVRLRGRNFSLKRSSALDGDHPKHLSLLETLNIFAVRANYMAQFREYLEREGVETEEAVQLPLAIRTNREFLGKGLVVPRVPADRFFMEEVDIILELDPSICVRVDLSLKVQIIESYEGEVATTDAGTGREQNIPEESLELVDWERVCLELLGYKERKGLDNLVIRPETLKKVFSPAKDGRFYSLIADEKVVKPGLFSETAILQEAVLSILQKYVDTFYRLRRERWDSSQMVYKVLDESDPNLSLNRKIVKEGEPSSYVVRIQRSEKELISAVQSLIDEGGRLYEEEKGKLKRIHFDRHLYQPLLIEHADKVKIAPPGLNESELRFVQDLKRYWQVEKDKSLSDMDVFLLRNLGKGTGIGFFEERGFYPDFILWILDDCRQHIVFIEPHGMIHAKAYKHDEKARLHENLPNLAKEIGARTKRKNVTLDSYIISATPYEDLRFRYDDGTWDRDRFAGVHILFPDRIEGYNYLATIMGGADSRNGNP